MFRNKKGLGLGIYIVDTYTQNIISEKFFGVFCLEYSFRYRVGYKCFIGLYFGADRYP